MLVITPTSFEITLSQGEAFVPVVIEESLSATFSVGSLTVNDVTMGLTGQEVTAVLGTPVVADMTVGMTGLDLTLSQGTAFAPNDTVIISGQEITLTQGTATGSFFTRSRLNRYCSNIYFRFCNYTK